MTQRAASSVLDAASAEFINGPVTFVVASRNPRLIASVCYGMGARPAVAGGPVTIFMPVQRAMTLLDDLRECRAIAVCSCQPSTLRTIQMKGTDASISQLVAGDAAHMQSYRARFTEELLSIGDDPDFIESVFHVSPDDCVAITFTPTAVFVQTPGPQAGTAMTAGGAP